LTTEEVLGIVLRKDVFLETRNKDKIMRLAKLAQPVLLVVGLAAIIATCPAHAQTETVLYNFTGGSDGSNPYSRLTADGAGNLYGTTNDGGLGYGVIFELSPNGNGAWNETVLHTFTNGQMVRIQITLP
jgi:hypothetical protein